MADTPVKLQFNVTIYRDGIPPITVSCHGRCGWAILSLVAAGKPGCTPISRPAPRWSDYVFKARTLGLNIETIHEGHEGSFPGHHGRYILRDRVTISGGTLNEYLSSPEGRRDFPHASFARQSA